MDEWIKSKPRPTCRLEKRTTVHTHFGYEVRDRLSVWIVWVTEKDSGWISCLFFEISEGKTLFYRRFPTPWAGHQWEGETDSNSLPKGERSQKRGERLWGRIETCSRRSWICWRDQLDNPGALNCQCPRGGHQHYSNLLSQGSRLQKASPPTRRQRSKR